MLILVVYCDDEVHVLPLDAVKPSTIKDEPVVKSTVKKLAK